MFGVTPHVVWVNGVISTVYLAYPVFLTEILRGTYLNCYGPVDGRKYVFGDFRQECAGSSWTASAVVAYVELLLLVPAVPLLNVWFMRRNKNNFENAVFKRRFLFMYGGYRPGCRAWESVVMLRKAAVILSVVVFKDSVLQLCWMQIVISSALVLHVFDRPYGHPMEQRVETVSLCSTLAIVTLGQAITMAEAYPALLAGLRAVAVFTNCTTLLWFVFAFFSEARRVRNEKARQRSASDPEAVA
eukprot:g275.t1